MDRRPPARVRRGSTSSGLKVEPPRRAATRRGGGTGDEGADGFRELGWHGTVRIVSRTVSYDTKSRYFIAHASMRGVRERCGRVPVSDPKRQGSRVRLPKGGAATKAPNPGSGDSLSYRPACNPTLGWVQCDRHIPAHDDLYIRSRHPVRADGGPGDPSTSPGHEGRCISPSATGLRTSASRSRRKATALTVGGGGGMGRSYAWRTESGWWKAMDAGGAGADSRTAERWSRGALGTSRALDAGDRLAAVEARIWATTPEVVTARGVGAGFDDRSWRHGEGSGADHRPQAESGIHSALPTTRAGRRAGAWPEWCAT